MSGIVPERVTARVDGEFVVFLIGMRINSWWKVHKWLPVFLAMPRMLRELDADSERGLLETRTWLGLRAPLLVQYWESFEALESYARDTEGEHLPAWKAFNRRVGEGGDVGIWHETFLVRDGEYEAVYNNMPPTGLGEVGEVVPASGRAETAGGRLGRSAGDDAPVDADG
ncbi:DUF4188 domain-containing protein [Haloplanus rubicundus]|uniref:DUF4188 domain-containing protein n=1 Tax=Haloplanus rubicundus TaxID=1547898 RepID=A0A345EAX4_9EURY|nr:DUF4188 domain-containing protein [Haloplanus rubicundus]AXG09346.1 DUF4188 domain-containing protein [Haloplanus rubicundus]